MGVGETITVINKSGKVVKSSRHIVDVLKEARSAYRERKAEIEAERKAERKAALEERKLREGLKTVRLDDDDDTRSRASHRSHRTSKSHRSSKSHRPRPPLDRSHTDPLYPSDGRDAHCADITRRHTAGPVQLAHKSDDIDMDLAYGDVPPPLPVQRYDSLELREKASALTRILDEANCLQHSATTTIDSLQKNPDALAAVGLALAEISTMVSKLGPSVLPALKTSFPAVAALLLSPQFMIAAGVGIGVTIVALGGYKIIKKIQSQNQADALLEPAYPPQGGAVRAPAPIADGPDHDVLDELETRELSRIELWRRGIADVEASSSGTTVDGEFVTPAASRHLISEGVLDGEELKSRRAKSHRAKSVRSVRTSASRRDGDDRPKAKSSSKKPKGAKEPSLLKTLFRGPAVH